MILEWNTFALPIYFQILSPRRGRNGKGFEANPQGCRFQSLYLGPNLPINSKYFQILFFIRFIKNLTCLQILCYLQVLHLKAVNRTIISCFLFIYFLKTANCYLILKAFNCTIIPGFFVFFYNFKVIVYW